MAELHIQAKVLGGAQLETTAREMQRLADALGVTVDLKFNDIELHAVPGGAADWLIRNWRRVRDGEFYPSAWSHHHPDTTSRPPLSPDQWDCRCGYQNTGPICTKCGQLRQGQRR